MLPAHMKMNEYEKYQMETMSKYGISTLRIYGYFAAQAGGNENLSFLRRDMYNEQFKERGSNMSDVKDAIDFLKGMRIMDDMMYWRHTIKEDKMIRRLF